MNDVNPLILVTGATGTQGGATARALLKAGKRVRALVRNPDGEAARTLHESGCEIAVGDFEKPETLAAAMDGAAGVFSLLRPDFDNSNSEYRHGEALVEAAKAAGIEHFVHSSVCQVEGYEDFPRWDEGYWSVSYWRDKWLVEEMVRNAGLAKWTILRPSFIMENFATAKASFLFPQLQEGILLTPVKPDAKVQLIAADDIGAFAAAAFANPALFSHEAIDLAGDELFIGDIADTLGDVLGGKVTAVSVSPDKAEESGLAPTWIRSQEWINDVGYHVDLGALDQYGIAMTSFRNWVERHRAAISIGR